FPAGLGEIAQGSARFGLLCAARVETERLEMVLERSSGVCRRVRWYLDRDFDEVVAVRKSPLLDGDLVRKRFVRQFPAQNANGTHDQQLSKIDRARVELGEEPLLVLRKELLDRSVVRGNLFDFVTGLSVRERRREDDAVADTIGLELEAFHLPPVTREGR